MIEYLFMKNDVELKHDLKDYKITATRSSGPGMYRHIGTSTLKGFLSIICPIPPDHKIVGMALHSVLSIIA